MFQKGCSYCGKVEKNELGNECISFSIEEPTYTIENRENKQKRIVCTECLIKALDNALIQK